MEKLNGEDSLRSGPFVPMLTQTPLCFKGQEVLRGRKNSLPEGAGRLAVWAFYSVFCRKETMT